MLPKPIAAASQNPADLKFRKNLEDIRELVASLEVATKKGCPTAAVFRQNIDKSISALKARAASSNDAEIQYKLGCIYELGLGVPQNDATAADWFELAAAQKHPDAQFQLGTLCVQGRGVQENPPRTIELYTLSAYEGGNAQAQYALALIYAVGCKEAPKNEEKAKELFELASRQDDAESQFELARIYDIGIGIPPDLKNALKWYKAAAKQGHPGASFYLSNYLFQGIGSHRSPGEARQLLESSAEAGFAEAQNKWGVINLREGQDNTRAIELIVAAAKQGYASAQFNLGQLYTEGIHAQKDEAKAAKWFELAAKQGNANAQFKLAVYWTKQNCPPEKALPWHAAAAAQGHTKALYSLAYYWWLVGISGLLDKSIERWVIFSYLWGQKDPNQLRQDAQKYAVDLFQQASDQGFGKATARLAYCYYHGIGIDANQKHAHKLYFKAKSQLHEPNNLQWLQTEIGDKINIPAVVVVAPNPLSPSAIPFHAQAPKHKEEKHEDGRPLPQRQKLKTRGRQGVRATKPIAQDELPSKTWKAGGNIQHNYNYYKLLYPYSVHMQDRNRYRKLAYPLFLTMDDKNKDTPNQYCAINPTAYHSLKKAPDLMKAFENALEKGNAGAKENEVGVKFIGAIKIFFPQENLQRSFTLFEIKLLGKYGNDRLLGYLRPDNLIEFYEHFQHGAASLESAKQRLSHIIQNEMIALNLL